HSTAKIAIAVISANRNHKVMISNRRLDTHIPVAAPEADRDVHPRLRFGFTSRTAIRATDNSPRRRDIGKRDYIKCGSSSGAGRTADGTGAECLWRSRLGGGLALAVDRHLGRLAEH